MGSHAILSPSAASRWMTCTPAPRLEELYPDSSSEFADEGTVAHAVAEAYLLYHHDLDAYADALNALFLDSYHGPMFDKHFSPELEQHAIDFGDFVLEEAVGDHALLVEQRLDLRRWVPEGFGTADGIVVRDGTLFMNDLKYGKGVKVSAVENKQLMIYALGCIEAYSFLYDFDTVSMRIFQPRINNISVFSMSVADLMEWAKEVSVKAELAFKGEGEFVPGEHCRFCKAKAECKALADFAMQEVVDEFKDDEEGIAQIRGLLSDQEVADILKKMPVAEIFFKAVKDHAYSKLLSGDKLPGFKLVEGRRTRYFTDPDKVKEILDSSQFKDLVYTPPKPAELKTLSAIETSIKKKNFNALLSPYVSLRDGKPTIAEEADPREEYSSIDIDFADD